MAGRAAADSRRRGLTVSDPPVDSPADVLYTPLTQHVVRGTMLEELATPIADLQSQIEDTWRHL
jgi:hypothetical protein